MTGLKPPVAFSDKKRAVKQRNVLESFQHTFLEHLADLLQQGQCLGGKGTTPITGSRDEY